MSRDIFFWSRKWQPTPLFFPVWRATVYGVTKSQTRLSIHRHKHTNRRVWESQLVGEGRGATCNQWVKARDTAKHLTMHRTAPQQRVIWPQISTVPRLRNCSEKESKLNTSYPLPTVMNRPLCSTLPLFDLCHR